MTAVCEVGPGTVRLLSASRAEPEPELVEAVLDAGAEPLVLLGDRPVPTVELWCTLFERLLAPTGGALLVHPSWWSPTRVGVAVRAAQRVAHTVSACPRHRLLHGDAAFVEIGPQLVAVGDRGGVTRTEARWEHVADVVEAVVRGFAADTGCVHVDAPVGVPGAAALGSLIARRLREHGRPVRLVGEHQLWAAAARSAGGCTAGPPIVVPWHRATPVRVLTAAAVATAIAVAGFFNADRSHLPATEFATTELVEGRVAVRVPVDWTVQRITGGPGSARVQVSSPTDHGVSLQITQARVPTDDLAATADTLRAAVDAQPRGVFVEFTPADRRAGRPAVTYREVRSGRDIRWTVVVSGGVRIGIGCQSAPEAVCQEAIGSARHIG